MAVADASTGTANREFKGGQVRVDKKIQTSRCG